MKDLYGMGSHGKSEGDALPARPDTLERPPQGGGLGDTMPPGAGGLGDGDL